MSPFALAVVSTGKGVRTVQQEVALRDYKAQFVQEPGLLGQFLGRMAITGSRRHYGEAGHKGKGDGKGKEHPKGQTKSQEQPKAKGYLGQQGMAPLPPPPNPPISEHHGYDMIRHGCSLRPHSTKHSCGTRHIPSSREQHRVIPAARACEFGSYQPRQRGAETSTGGLQRDAEQRSHCDRRRRRPSYGRRERHEGGKLHEDPRAGLQHLTESLEELAKQADQEHTCGGARATEEATSEGRDNGHPSRSSRWCCANFRSCWFALSATFWYGSQWMTSCIPVRSRRGQLNAMILDWA